MKKKKGQNQTLKYPKLNSPNNYPNNLLSQSSMTINPLSKKFNTSSLKISLVQNSKLISLPNPKSKTLKPTSRTINLLIPLTAAINQKSQKNYLVKTKINSKPRNA